MSYNLMVFEEDRAPKTKDEFMQWFRRQTEWGEEHDYDSIDVSGPALKAWFMEMKDHFPPMNGTFAPDPDEFEDFDSRTGDYSIGREMIYAGFAWSAAKEAHDLACQLAKKHGLGFFDAEGDGKIIFPDGSEPDAGPSPKSWFRFFRRR